MCYNLLQKKECAAEFKVGVEEIYMYNQMSLNNILNKALLNMNLCSTPPKHPIVDGSGKP